MIKPGFTITGWGDVAAVEAGDGVVEEELEGLWVLGKLGFGAWVEVPAGEAYAGAGVGRAEFRGVLDVDFVGQLVWTQFTLCL